MYIALTRDSRDPIIGSTRSTKGGRSMSNEEQQGRQRGFWATLAKSVAEIIVLILRLTFAAVRAWWRWAGRRTSTWGKVLAYGGPIAVVLVIIIAAATSGSGGDDGDDNHAATLPTQAQQATATATSEVTPSPEVTPTSEATPTPGAFETARPAVTATAEGVAAPYEIVERHDISLGGAVRVVRVRFSIRVEREATEAQLRQIAEDIIESEKKAQSVNAISFFFYLPGSDTTGMYTAGKADWAPDGEWGNADQVKAGDYSRHELVVEAGGVFTPVTPSGPAAEIPESTRRQMFYDLVAAQNSGIGDQEAYEVIAQRYGVSVDVVEQVTAEGVTKGWPMPLPP
jgi:hypothetical protein